MGGVGAKAEQGVLTPNSMSAVVRVSMDGKPIALLAGEFEGRWALRWRIEYFFLLVKIQAWLPFSPRIRFGPRKLNPALPPTAGKA